MALPTATTAASIASLTLLSFCGWGPGGGGGGPQVEPPRWETAERRDTQDWDSDPGDPDTETPDWDTDSDPDTDRDSDSDTQFDSDTDSDTTTTTGMVRSTIVASEIAVSESNTCAIIADQVRCWGDDRFGMVTHVPTAPVRDVTLGWDFGCAITTTTDTVVCWGDDTFATATNAPAGPFATVSAGTSHVCATTTTGAVTCWGSDAFGKATPPEDVPLFNVSAGDQHSCGLTADGDRQCWGDSGLWTAQRVGPFASVDAGRSASCMQDNTGFVPSLACDGAFADTTPMHAEQFDLGRHGKLCSVFGGDISCLGTTATPPTSSGDNLFIEVVVGQSHYCARTGAGSVTCWGTSERGALGLPTAD